MIVAGGRSRGRAHKESSGGEGRVYSVMTSTDKSRRGTSSENL